jgi:5-methylcytosine-specific restriction enzyme A
MARSEFPAKVKREAWDRCKGLCDGCTAKLFPGRYQFDHDRADGLGGEPTIENCKVLCTSCHDVKTHKHDRPIMQKADNIKAKHLGIKRPSGFRKPPPGYNAWTRRIET